MMRRGSVSLGDVLKSWRRRSRHSSDFREDTGDETHINEIERRDDCNRQQSIGGATLTGSPLERKDVLTADCDSGVPNPQTMLDPQDISLPQSDDEDETRSQKATSYGDMLISRVNIDDVRTGSRALSTPKFLTISSSGVGEDTSNCCFICGSEIGKLGREGRPAEKKTYLPCGHWFGNVCIYYWITELEHGRERCPHRDCITIRHACEHLAAPLLEQPRLLYADTTSAVIPWNYEFCLTPEGKRLHDSIENAASKVRKSQSRRTNNREWSSLDLGWSAIYKFYSRLLEGAEKNLDKRQKIWWVQHWQRVQAAPLQPAQQLARQSVVYGGLPSP